MQHSGVPTISVIIPVFNGEGDYLRQTLAAVFAQDVAVPFEVIVIDSGSRDDSVAIARSCAARVHEIPNAEFGHGRTRNLGAEMARGEYLVYLTQDATPASNTWLAALVAPFAKDERIVNVVGRQVPRADAHPMVRRTLAAVFDRLGPPDGDAVVFAGDPDAQKDAKQREILCYNADVNAAYRRSAWEHVPFRDVAYAEDQLIAADMLRAGYHRAYAPQATVMHSHTYPLGEWFGRFLDEYVQMRRLAGVVPDAALWRIVPGMLNGWMRDTGLLLRMTDATLVQRIVWWLQSPLLHLMRRLAAWVSIYADRLPVWLMRRMGRETRLRSGA